MLAEIREDFGKIKTNKHRNTIFTSAVLLYGYDEAVIDYNATYIALTRRRGMGAQVKNTVTRRNDFRPHTSDRAPINGAERNDRMPFS